MNNDFTIDERFEFLNNYLKLISTKQMNSLILMGQSGIGKTHEVKKYLTSENITPSYIKGFSTARALYDELYHNRNGLIVFDDCDSILEDKVAINILKGALDSYDDRVISWLSKSKDVSIPKQFNFKGQVIFISNLDVSKFDKAILSRALTIDLSMTYDEKIIRMSNILNELKPSILYTDKALVLNFLMCNVQTDDDLNIRTLEKGIMFKVTNPINWERQFLFELTK